MTLAAYRETTTSSTSAYFPTPKERKIFRALFAGACLVWNWDEPMFRPEPVPEKITPPKQLDWYDSEGLTQLFQEIGESQVAFAELGMGEYRELLAACDENEVD